jgi:hypothetical protein
MERFDDPSHICGEGMQRDAFQRTSAFASPAWIHRDSAKARMREAPGEVVEVTRIKAPTWNQHDRIPRSIIEEFNHGLADFYFAL